VAELFTCVCAEICRSNELFSMHTGRCITDWRDDAHLYRCVYLQNTWPCNTLVLSPLCISYLHQLLLLLLMINEPVITHAGGSQPMRGHAHHLCVCVRAVKGKRLELSTPKLVQM